MTVIIIANIMDANYVVGLMLKALNASSCIREWSSHVENKVTAYAY